MSNVAKESDWAKFRATLSDKSARAEYGLTQEEIVDGINAGKLQFRLNSAHGNPWFKVLSSEVEALVIELYGESHQKTRTLQCQIAQIDAQIRKSKAQITSLTKKRAEFLAALEATGSDE